MAIAYDNSNFGIFTDHASTTDTISLSVGSGSDRILFVTVSIYNGTPTTVSGITYAGVSMTQINTQLFSTNYRQYLFYLVAPATGSNNIVVTYPNSTYQTRTSIAAVSYSGASQTSQPDSYNSATNASTTSLTATTTVVNSDCWLVTGAMGLRNNLAGGTGTTLRTATNATVSAWIFDSNGTVGTGSQSLIVTQSTAGPMGLLIASFKPATGAPATNSAFLMFM